VTLSPASLAMLRVLADGDWHPLEEVLEAGMDVIPPGKALRVAERERQRSWVARGLPPETMRPRPTDHARWRGIRAGQRMMASSSLRRLRYVEAAVIDGVKHLRDLRPDLTPP